MHSVTSDRREQPLTAVLSFWAEQDPCTVSRLGGGDASQTDHPCLRIGGAPSREGEIVSRTIADPNVALEVTVSCGNSGGTLC
jgi:hypothetical protein